MGRGQDQGKKTLRAAGESLSRQLQSLRVSDTPRHLDCRSCASQVSRCVRQVQPKAKGSRLDTCLTGLPSFAIRDPTLVQAEVACATSVVVASFPESQDLFAQHDVIQLLLSRLTSKLEEDYSWHMKTMAAKALRELAKGNSSISKSITDLKRFLSFADLLETQDKEVRFNSLMVLIEITSVAEHDSCLRRHSAFKCKSPVFKAIVNQFHKLIEENGDTVLLIPYIKLIGNLARSFRVSDTSMIEQLVKLLSHRDPEVAREAILAITKFASPCNYLHIDHSKTMVEAGAARRLIELFSLGCEIRIGMCMGATIE